MGKVSGIKAKMILKEGAQPVFLKARPIPYSLREKVEKELDRLQKDGVISRVDWSDWATPIVVVPKPNGTIRLCGDFKMTINPVLKVDQYPLPKMDDIFAALGKGALFSKIDLQWAYLQMELDEESRGLLTVNTHKGLFQFNRMAFGVASAPAIWQRTMDTILQGIPNVQCFLDDIVVAGGNMEEHLHLLETVFKRLEQYGLTINKKKSVFFRRQIEFCGHVIDAQGLHKTTEKIQAIVESPKPMNVSQLRSFLGMVNYYRKFLPNLSTKLAPLHALLQKDVKWSWTKACEEAWKMVKDMVTADTVLAHFDPSLPMTLACDASSYGLGAVLSHITATGEERPVAFASRTLTVTEQKYSQIDKEALALVWGIKKFNQYLFGSHFTLITDHQPLTVIFRPDKGISITTAARLQRYAMFLAGYDFEIKYRNTSQHANADALSRLPLPSQDGTEQDGMGNLFIKQIENLPITAMSLKGATQNDPILAKVLHFTLSGWPVKGCEECPDLKPYYDRRHELTIEQSCIMWGIRVVIPTKLRDRVLEELHDGHLGVVKMKGLARSHVWWPGIDKGIEEVTHACQGCQRMKQNPKLSTLHPWEFPEGPGKRIHIDFAGPFENKTLLCVVDAYSKWPEVVTMEKTTAESTIEELRLLVARWGIPVQIVTDNGPQFASQAFERFTSLNHIKHITTSPYHPATNGLAERFVQTLKQALRSSTKDGRTFQHRLASFLMNYRNARHATTEESPARLMIGRDVRSRLHLLTPDLAGTVAKNQSVQVQARATARDRSFEVGDWVMVRDYRRPGTERWCQAQVKAKVGPKTYHVQVGGSNLWKRHVEQMIRSGSDQLGVSGPREDSEVPVPIICQEADTTHPTPMLPSIPYNGVGAAPVSPQVGGRSEETREVPSLETREPTTPFSRRQRSIDNVVKSPMVTRFLEKNRMVEGPQTPLLFLPQMRLAAPPSSVRKRNPDERPITSTRSGRIVRKPARYREEGEKM